MDYKKGYIDGVRGVCDFLHGMRDAAIRDYKQNGDILSKAGVIILGQVVEELKKNEEKLYENSTKKEVVQ